MNKCNVGIIGLGGFAGLIFRALNESNVAQLVAGADTNPDRLNKFKEQADIRLCDDGAEILQDPDVDIVVISTPPAHHFRLGKLAINSGKHVFFEKPGALSPDEMSQLIYLAEQRHVKTSIDFVMRQNPLYFILKQICTKSIFGLPERAFLENYAHDDSLEPHHWFWDYRESGGIWVEHGVHFFDLTNWLLGFPVKCRGEKMKRKDVNIVDRVMGTSFHGDDVPVSYYHGFTKPEAFENTHFNLIFERAYARAYGWIPVKLIIDAMIVPEVERYMMEDILKAARSYLSGVDVTLKTRLKNKWGDSTFKGRGKEYRATARVEFTYMLNKDRWEVYKCCIRQGIEDLIRVINGQMSQTKVTLGDAKKALDVALMMEGN